MNKQDWDNSLLEHFAPKKAGLNLDLLMEMVKEVMDSGGTLLSEAEEQSMEELYKFLPQFEFSEMIGRPDDADIANKGEVRATFTSMMSGIGGDGSELQDKINAVNAFVAAPSGEASTAQDILRNLTFLRLLSVVVQDFTDAGAGFIFEAFLAGLLGGKQISGKEGGSLPIHDYQLADGVPVSLKLLSPGTKIDGSLENITRFLSKNEYGQQHGIRYIVAIKFSDEKLGFYRFTITRENYFSWLGDFVDLDKINIELAAEDAQLQEAEEDSRIPELRAHSAAFKEKVISLMPMLGVSIENASKKLRDIDDAAEFTGSRGRIRPTSGIMQSKEGIAAFNEFVKVAGIDPKEHPKTIIPQNPDADALKIARGARNDLLKKAFLSLSEDNVLSLRPFQRLSQLTAKKSEPEMSGSASEKMAYLQKLATSSNKEDWELWGDLILGTNRGQSNKAEVFTKKERGQGKGRVGHTQFSMDQKVLNRPDATTYGNLVIGKSQVLKVMNSYGTILRNEIMPIYEQLYNITSAINSFFVEGDLSAGSRAETAGNKLEVETNTLASNATEK
jgi:hypothetical protein